MSDHEDYQQDRVRVNGSLEREEREEREDDQHTDHRADRKVKVECVIRLSEKR